MAQHVLEVDVIVRNRGLGNGQGDAQVCFALLSHLLCGIGNVKFIAPLSRGDLQGLLVNGGLLGGEAILVVDALQVRKLRGGFGNRPGVGAAEVPRLISGQQVLVQGVSVDFGPCLAGSNDQSLGDNLGVRHIRLVSF